MALRHRLLITEADYQKVLRHVGDCADERMAFLYCGSTSFAGRTDWLVRSADLPGDDEYRRQEPARVTLKSEAVVGRVLRARNAAGFVDVHSHPFADRPWPSRTDERGAEVQLAVLRDLAPGTTLLRMVTGFKGSLFGAVRDTAQDAWLPLSEVLVLGRRGRETVRPVNSVEKKVACVQELDARTSAVVGGAIGALGNTRVLVIGAGGVGSAVLSQVAGLVGHIDIVDPDVIETHNLPRLHCATEADVGRPKAEASAQVLDRRFSRLQVGSHVGYFPDSRSEEMFRAADFVFCCPDHHAVRWAAASLAARTMRPLVEVGCGGRRSEDGAITALGHHVRLQVPGGPCLACNGLDLARLEDPSSTARKVVAGYIDGEDSVRGELVTLTTRAATDAVEVFLRYVTSYAGNAPGHIYFDAIHFTSLDLTGNYQSDPACSLCGQGDHALRAAGDVLSDDQRVLAPQQELTNAAM